MNTFFVVLIAIAMVATLGALLFGVVTMARGGEGAARRSNKFMRYRVLLQAVAIGLFALLMLLTR
jgi:hypothetical protein